MKSTASGRQAGAIAALVVTLLSGGPAAAQIVDCNRIALQLSTLGRNSGSGRMQAAARKQQTEIARTVGYARSLGCDRAHFLFFDERPAQCEGLNARIERMRANLAQLQRSALGDDGARQRLQNQYEVYCRGGDRQPNFIERLFGGEPEKTYPPEPALPPPDQPQEVQDQAPRGGNEAVCVRTCDGGFFPVTYSARHADLGDLQKMCTALCPNAEVKLYTRSFSGGMKTAISADGEAYSSLENAFKYEKTVVPQCTCKPPNESWAQALQPAEELLGQAHKGDIIVTQEKADELSRAPQPGAKAVQDKDRTAAKFDPKAMKKLLEEKKKAADAESEEERAMAEQAPTASHESSGIDFSRDSTGVIRDDDVDPGDSGSRPARKPARRLRDDR